MRRLRKRKTTAAGSHRASVRWLNGALLLALAALVATALTFSALGHPSAGRAPGHHHEPVPPPGTSPASATTSSIPATTSSIPATTSPAPPTTTVPGATTGAVTRPAIGGDCGLALEPQTVSGDALGSARRVGHCTVLEIGDSLGNDMGWGIDREVSASSGLRLVQEDVSSTGLANVSFYNWQATLSSELRQYHPNLVLICLGGNDQQGIYVDGNAVQFPSPTWQRGYLARVKDLVGEASKAGAYVAWVGLPIMEQPSYSDGAHLLDHLYKEGVTAVANATYISTWSLFANPVGQFQSNASVNGTPTTLRQADGIHYSFSGEDVLATYVLRKLAAIYHVALQPTNPAVITSWG